MSRKIEAFAALCGLVLPFAAWAEGRPDLVAKVESGEIQEAHISWWGFDKEDSTPYLKAAIASKARTIVLDAMPSPWFVTPLYGRSDLTLRLEPGSVLAAKRGAYHQQNESLLSYRCATNIAIVGSGEIRMWREDYTNRALYAWSEWRHAVNLLSCSRVRIEGVTIAESGGDGIYLGEGVRGRPNTKVLIREVKCRGNNRQGLSVITADQLLVERCTFRDTCGTDPQSGIDFEPNAPHQSLSRIVVRDCLSEGNAGAGFDFAKWLMGNRADPIDITLENCISMGNRRGGAVVEISPNRYRDAHGRITFRNCTLMDAKQRPDNLRNKTGIRAAFQLVFENCRVRDNTAAAGYTVMNERWADPLEDAVVALPALEAKLPADDVEVTDQNPGCPVKVNAPFFRYRSRFFVFAEREGTVRYRVQLKKIGSNAVYRRACFALDRAGRKVVDLPSPELEPTEWSFAVPARGFYEIRADVDGNSFGFLETTTPIAVAGGGPNYDRVAGLMAQPGELFFQVDADTPSFGFVLAGGGGSEMVSATLSDPAGAAACSFENVGWMREWRSPESPQPGLWRVDVKRPTKGCYDDHSVDVLNIEPVFFLTNAKYWKSKGVANR